MNDASGAARQQTFWLDRAGDGDHVLVEQAMILNMHSQPTLTACAILDGTRQTAPLAGSLHRLR